METALNKYSPSNCTFFATSPTRLTEWGEAVQSKQDLVFFISLFFLPFSFLLPTDSIFFIFSLGPTLSCFEMSVPENFAPAEKGLTLYSSGTPNGFKITIALELLGLPYKLIDVPLHKRVQFAPWYQKHIAVTNKIPVLFDRPENGTEVQLSESNLILQYLADKYDKAHKISFEHFTPEYYECLKWMSFANASIESVLAVGIFTKLFMPPKNYDEKSIKFYTLRTRLHFASVESHLKHGPNNTQRQYLVGEKLSMADIVTHCWIMCVTPLKIDLEKDFPATWEWLNRVYSNPHVQKGWNLPRIVPQFKQIMVVNPSKAAL